MLRPVSFSRRSVAYKLSSAFLALALPSYLLQHAAALSSVIMSQVNTKWALNFDNRNLRNLPVDPVQENYVRQVPQAIFSKVSPTPLLNPTLVAYSPSALELLGLDTAQVQEGDVARYLSGNEPLQGSQPAAHCYCGHQFGSFAGQLGDGAAILLGEVVNAQGGRWELQLKGAGRTPYSRGADGRKVLRSSLREFLCSEAMHFLNVPTTRAAAVVSSDSRVERDPFYDGRAVQERCAVVARIAPNFFRFGSLEIFKEKDPADGEYGRAGPSAKHPALKQQLLHHLLLYFPSICSQPVDFEEKLKLMYAEVVQRTARLVAQWQAVGFVHGVLNTDNLSLLGLTIDYGPFGFLEQFDPKYVPNGSDGTARYCYEEQAKVCHWNLGKLGEALSPLLPPYQSTALLSRFDALYQAEHLALFRQKMGLLSEQAGDGALVGGLLQAMGRSHGDFSDSFLALTEYHAELAEGGEGSAARERLLQKLVGRSASPRSVAQHFRRKLRIHRLSMALQQIEMLWAALQGDGQQARQMFGEDVPIEALRGEVGGEKRKLDLLVEASTTIKKYEQMQPENKVELDRKEWAAWLEVYFSRIAAEDRERVRGAGSGGEGKEGDRALGASLSRERVEKMRAVNPTVILRNWMAQLCIEKAEAGDYSYTRELLKLLQTPFDPSLSSFLHNPLPHQPSCSLDQQQGKGKGRRDLSEIQRQLLALPPEWADSLLCTCSS